MASLPKVTRQRTKFQNFAILDKMVKVGVSKEVAKIAQGMFPQQQFLGAISVSVPSRTDAKSASRKPALDNAKATRLAYLVSLAEDVFGNRKGALAFMTRHHAKLGATPVEKLETEWGGREVERILLSVIHGLPA